ncbi:MAG: penicillin-binding protein 2 [Bdellovibrionales bacterium]|nr:penicillin-binding protein 2 [Bdellovibrionales bacterium]
MAFLGQEEQIRELQDRFKFLYAAMFLGLGILLGRMVHLQLLQGDRMRMFSEENRIKRVKVAAPRGMIFDRNRRLLIDNRPAFDLEIIPQYLRESKKTEAVIAKLSKIIKMPEKEIQEILDKSKSQASFLPVKIKNDLTRDEVAQVEVWKIDMPGVQIQEEIKRTNLFGDVAAHLLGYIGEVNTVELPRLNKKALKYKLGDSIGKFGLEQQLEDILRGIDGERLVEVDAMGRIKLTRTKNRLVDPTLERASVPGKNLVLTIDQDLQLEAAKAFGDKSGSLVAIDPRSGEILAMISRPSFDPTEFSRGIPPQLWQSLLNNENRPLGDKTIQDHYPPGSTFKIVTAIAGLEEKVIDENTKFNCPGVIWMGNRAYHCHKKNGHGNVNVVDAITLSCDVFFYRVAQKLKSVDDIAKWAFHLGLGKKTGIQLARETAGLIPTEEWKKKRFNQVWNGGESLSVAIGQSFVLTTGLQLANLYASIANGGILYRPFLVKEIESYEGQILQHFKPESIDRHQLSPRTYELIKQGLWGVINRPNGTAAAQRLPGMDFAGKTGTVQVMRIAADKIYQKCQNMKYKDRHHGMFAGFAPVKDPVIAVSVIGEHVCSGSGGAAPIGRAVIKKYLEKYYPDLYGEKVLAARIKAEGKERGLPAKIKQVEEEGVTVNADSTVRTEPVPAPPAPPHPDAVMPQESENSEGDDE